MATKAFSVEDGNLQTAPILTSRINSYADIDLTFEKNTAGDVFTKKDAASVKQAIKNILLTNSTEKPFQPHYGANIVAMLFDLSTSIGIETLKENIQTSIAVYEPRALVRDVKVDKRPDNYSVAVTVTFQLLNTSAYETVNVNIVRLR
jgi:phage baseplate assembly protein W